MAQKKRDKHLIGQITEAYETVKQPIKLKEEENIEITAMYVYPINSVKPACEVEFIDIGPQGIKYDREIMLYDPARDIMVRNIDHFPLNRLRQQLVGSKVVVTTTRPERLEKEGLPTSITLDLDIPPEKISDATIKTRWTSFNWVSHVYPDEVNEWFAVAIELKGVKALRASFTKKNDQKKQYSKSGDELKGFIRGAAIHVLNETSCDDLDRRVRANYPEGLENYAGQKHDMWRPNLVIDTGEAYSEDHLKECRAGAAMLRFSGYAIRCPQVRVNVETESYIGEQEPYRTLSSYRLIKQEGAIFGVFLQADLLTSRAVHDGILPRELGFKSFSARKADGEVHFRAMDGNYYARMYKKDGLQVRLRKDMGWTKKFSKGSVLTDSKSQRAVGA